MFISGSILSWKAQLTFIFFRSDIFRAMLRLLTFIFLILFFYISIQSKRIDAQVEKLEFIEPLDRLGSFGASEDNSSVANSEGFINIEESDFFQGVGSDSKINPPNFKSWAINIRMGSYPSKMKAQQALLFLEQAFSKKESGVFQEVESDPKTSPLILKPWAVNMRIGLFSSKLEAQRVLQALEQVFSEKIFLSIIDSEQSMVMNKSNNFKPEKIIHPLVDDEYLIQVSTKSQSLRVRQSPSRLSPILYHLQNGSKIPLVESSFSGGVKDWFQIEYSKEKFGWISTAYSKKVKISKSSLPREMPGKNSNNFKPENIVHPVVSSKYLAEVVTEDQFLRIRQSPSSSSQVVYHLENKSKVPLVESSVVGGPEDWFQIEYSKEKFGWISAAYSKKVDTAMEKENISDLKAHKSLSDFDISRFYKWIEAWQNHSTDLYLSFYSRSFKGLKKSRAKWETARRDSLRANRSISIEVADVEIHQIDKTVEIYFTQIYKSRGFSDVGKKELVWKKEENDWKIIKESWRIS